MIDSVPSNSIVDEYTNHGRKINMDDDDMPISSRLHEARSEMFRPLFLEKSRFTRRTLAGCLIVSRCSMIGILTRSAAGCLDSPEEGRMEGWNPACMKIVVAVSMGSSLPLTFGTKAMAHSHRHREVEGSHLLVNIHTEEY